VKFRPCTLEDKMNYYGTYQDVIREYVLKQSIKKDNIVYGSQAVASSINQIHMTRKPRDWDILSKHPKRDAFEIAEELNKHYGCYMFVVLHKRVPHSEGYGIMDVYSVKNTAIKYPYTKQRGPFSVYVPATRYSPNPEERKAISSYRRLTEIDYTKIVEPDNYVLINSQYGKYKARPVETIQKQREKLLENPEAEFRRKKDIGMIQDINRYSKVQRVKSDLSSGTFRIIEPTGRESTASVKGAIQDKKKRYR